MWSALEPCSRDRFCRPGSPPSSGDRCDSAGLSEELTNTLKKAAHEALGATCVPEDFVQIPAIPRTHNAKPMRNVVGRLFLAESSSLNDVSEIANASCLLELKAAIDEWRFQQALPQLDERC